MPGNLLATGWFGRIYEVLLSELTTKVWTAVIPVPYERWFCRTWARFSGLVVALIWCPHLFRRASFLDCYSSVEEMWTETRTFLPFDFALSFWYLMYYECFSRWLPFRYSRDSHFLRVFIRDIFFSQACASIFCPKKLHRTSRSGKNLQTFRNSLLL